MRVNVWDSKWTAYDVMEVVGGAGDRLDEVMLPKVQTAAEVVALDLLLTQVEAHAGLPIGHIGIEAQIETARGLINVEEICAASPAPRDASSSDPRTSPPPWRCRSSPEGCRSPSIPATTSTTCSRRSSWPGGPTGCRSSTVRTSTSATPTASATTASAPRPSATTANGRCTPTRSTILNEVFSPTQEQFDRAWAILDAYREATEAQGMGAVMFGDEMIDEASRKMATKFVTRGERAGLLRSPKT